MIPFTVEQQTAAIVQRLGKFTRAARTGLNFRMPLIEDVVGTVNLRVRQLDVEVETKTEDNVFVRVLVSVQFYVLPDKIFEAFYKLENPEVQIKSFVFDVVRARVPRIKLDDVFEKKDEIADVVKSELSQVMDDFGYGIVKALVTDIDPDPKVKDAMNESIADQRRAIVEGLRESVGEFQKTVNGASAQDVMNLILMTQYFDTLKDIGGHSKASTILIPHSPWHMSDIAGQIRDAMITGDQVRQMSAEQEREVTVKVEPGEES